MFIIKLNDERRNVFSATTFYSFSHARHSISCFESSRDCKRDIGRCFKTLQAKKQQISINKIITSYFEWHYINLFLYLSYHWLKFMLPSIFWDCMCVKSHLFSTSDLLFYICIWIFMVFLHSADVQQDRFNMLCNPSSFAPSLLPGHLMQHNESVADTLRGSLCQRQWYGSKKLSEIIQNMLCILRCLF